MYCEDLSNLSQRLCLHFGKNNVILCGFQGVGKTTQGKKLAVELEWDFIDTDALISTLYILRSDFHNRKMYKVELMEFSAPVLHSQLGETEFRRLEEIVVSSLKGVQHKVIALGGGVPLSLKNRSLLKELGVVIYLRCLEDELIQSLVKRIPFPSYLDKNNPIDSIREMFRFRDPIYREFADVEK